MSDYSLINKIPQLSSVEKKIIVDHPLLDKKQWLNSTYDEIKLRIKKELYYNQFDRCAYCRKIIEADAKYEPMDHIVAKSIKPEWMYEPNNLVVTCDSCNNLKNDDQTLVPAYITTATYPTESKAFLVFNPHFDIWSEHLQYEDEIFLVGVPGSKGADTIKICKLYRYNIIINRAKELKLEQKTPSEKALFRLRKLDVNSPDYTLLKDQLIDAMTHFLQRLDNNPNFIT